MASTGLEVLHLPGASHSASHHPCDKHTSSCKPWTLHCRLEICTFLVPHYFLPIGAVANAIKGLSWMAGGSTKSVFKVRNHCWAG